MHELYVICPTTGQPVYAGVQADTASRTVPISFANSMCPACGKRHEWQASGITFEIPISRSLQQAA